MELEKFYSGKRVFVTGHTGFKGSWLCRMLVGLGAQVTGYALAPEGENLFELSGLEREICSVMGDIRDMDTLSKALKAARPEVVLHLAAQPLVQEGFKNPLETYEVNVMGTVKLLECLRRMKWAGSFINVTTDKVYQNKEWCWGYRETDTLDGHDPYSNSKSCSELVTHCFRDTYFSDGGPAVSTMRAGNVIGGGDFAENRLIPDCVRAVQAKQPVLLRNPRSTRPYQHVLEPLYAYLLVAAEQAQQPAKAGCYNIGPGDEGCVNNQTLAELFCKDWGQDARWEALSRQDAFPEANFLRLDCSLLRSAFGWKPRWDIKKAVEKTVEWTREYFAAGDIPAMMDRQIQEFMEEGA
ncbi:CDP-glucose 4,6-dehydratase [Oscillospiraceae bacterium MB08-C2-2]|nr:CDP-glucose 4,6-dehydratase [Oscillospiraceae bacterium MB08-C2-2]